MSSPEKKLCVFLLSVRKEKEKMKFASGFNAKIQDEAGWTGQEAASAQDLHSSSVVGLHGSARELSSCCVWKWNLISFTLKEMPSMNGVTGFSITIKTNLLPSSVIRFWRQRRDKCKMNPWSTSYLRVPLLLLHKCCNGWLSHAKCTLQTNCTIIPFWKLLSSATHQQGGWKCCYRRSCNSSCPGKLNNGVFSSQETTYMTLERKIESRACFSRTCANHTSHCYWIALENSGKRYSNEVSISLGFILLEMPCGHQAGSTLGCARENLPEPKPDTNMKGMKGGLGGKYRPTDIMYLGIPVYCSNN